MSESPLPDLTHDAKGIPLPPSHLSRRNRWSLCLAGLFDRTHYRKTAEGEATHFTLRLGAQTQAGLTRVAQWETERHKELSIREAQALRILEASIPNAAATRPVSELDELDRRGRLEWAAENRMAATATAQRRAQQMARTAAEQDLVVVREELEHLGHEAEGARARWRADLHERCMFYARFRSRRITGAQLYDAILRDL